MEFCTGFFKFFLQFGNALLISAEQLTVYFIRLLIHHDHKGYESKRPKSVQVTLLQNGTAYSTQTLSETNGWQYTWDKLPKYDKNGREISWTIREVSVSGYVSSVRQNGYTFVLTNTLDKQKLPQTGVLWWPVPVLACGGLAFLIVGTLSRKKKDHE